MATTYCKECCKMLHRPIVQSVFYIVFVSVCNRMCNFVVNPCSDLPERDSGGTQCLRGGYPESDSGSRRLTAAGCFTILNSNLAELIWNRYPIHDLMTSSMILQDWWHVYLSVSRWFTAINFNTPDATRRTALLRSFSLVICCSK